MALEFSPRFALIHTSSDTNIFSELMKRYSKKLSSSGADIVFDAISAIPTSVLTRLVGTTPCFQAYKADVSLLVQGKADSKDLDSVAALVRSKVGLGLRCLAMLPPFVPLTWWRRLMYVSGIWSSNACPADGC